MARTRSSARSDRDPTPPPPAQARARRPRVPPRDATAERREVRREEPRVEPRVVPPDASHDAAIRRLEEEQRQAREEQRQTREETRQARQDLSAVLETVRGMAVTLARLQKRPEDEVPQPVFVQDRDLPPPPPFAEPPVVQYSDPLPAEQFVVPPAVGQYTIPPPGMPGTPMAHVQGLPERVQAPGQRQYERGESSGYQGSIPHAGPKWDVDRFLKNGGSLFTGGTDPEAAITWFDDNEAVLDHMGCPQELRVRVATGAIRGAGRVWWRSAHSAFLGFRELEHIGWEEFRGVFYDQYFPCTVVEEKKVEFLSLLQGDMTVAEYHARFLALERFAPGSFPTERQRAARFVSGLRLSLHTTISSFQCATLQEAVARTLQNEAAHRIHHARRAQAQPVQQSGRQRHRSRGQDQQGPSQRRRTDDTVAVHAIQGQPAQQAARQPQVQQYQQQGGGQGYPVCPTCQRRHPGPCMRGTGACFSCGELGHRAAECPRRAQHQQQQHQPRPQQYKQGQQQQQYQLRQQ